MFVACGIWCLADVLSVSTSSKQGGGVGLVFERRDKTYIYIYIYMFYIYIYIYMSHILTLTYHYIDNYCIYDTSILCQNQWRIYFKNIKNTNLAGTTGKEQNQSEKNCK